MYLNSAIFSVDEKPYCVWDVEMESRTIRFLKALDSEYFHYLATTHAEGLNNEKTKIKASIALRTAYYQALETFFTLIGAMIQAPGCEYAYVLRADSLRLRSVIQKICKGEKIFHCYKSKDPITWDRVSEIIHGKLDIDNRDEIITGFAACWRKFAHDFLYDKYIQEYNSIKHGLRVMGGGFEIKFGKEEVPGVQCPDEKMQSLGKSEFGSTFFIKDQIEGSKPNHSDPHFTTRQVSLNWNAENVVNGLLILSYSINNVASHLRLRNNDRPSGNDFKIPDHPDGLSSPWKNSVGLLSTNFDFPVTEQDITRHSMHELKMAVSGESSGS